MNLTILYADFAQQISETRGEISEGRVLAGDLSLIVMGRGPNGFELRRRGTGLQRQSQHPHHTTSKANLAASPVRSSDSLCKKSKFSRVNGPASHLLHSQPVFTGTEPYIKLILAFSSHYKSFCRLFTQSGEWLYGQACWNEPT